MTFSRRCLPLFTLALLGALLPLRAALSSEPDPYAATREAFKQAYSRAHVAEEPQTGDSKALRAYPLYPYLQRARLEHALTRATEWSPADEYVQNFLASYETEPVGRGLRRVWLKSLARREQWRALIDHYRPEAADATLRCQFLRARITLAKNDAHALEQVKADAVNQWLTPSRLPSQCEPVFEWLRTNGAMTADLIEQRVRLLLENGQHEFARIIARPLPADRAAPLKQWADLLAKPAQAIDAILKSSSEQSIEPQALLAGWSWLARSNPDEARKRYEALVTKRRLNAEEASNYALVLALGLAWSRKPEALDYFARVTPAALDDYALGWRARAALWAGNWKVADASIAAMSEKQRDEPRWKYWAARVAEKRGDRGRAAALYASILSSDNFYAAHAAARLGKPAQPNPTPLERNSSVIERIVAQPFFVRSRELLLADMRAEAVTEWLAGASTLTDDERKQAVHLAAHWGMHDVAISTAARQGIFYDYELLYPRPYDEHVQRAASLADVDVPLLYGLIRQESLFRRDAVSAAGAVGLAQLMPSTARIMARRLKESLPRKQDLFDPAVNVRLGASYLRNLIDRFNGQIFVALAGYNAGPRTVERWLPPKPVDADIWIENIPYNETREYVQRVIWHSIVFAWLRTGKAQDASLWLTTVVPPQLTADNSTESEGA